MKMMLMKMQMRMRMRKVSAEVSVSGVRRESIQHQMLALTLSFSFSVFSEFDLECVDLGGFWHLGGFGIDVVVCRTFTGFTPPTCFW